MADAEQERGEGAGTATAHRDAVGVAPPTVACRADAGRDVLDVAAAPLAGEGLCVRAAEPGRTGRVRCEHGPATAGEVGHDGPPDSRRLTGRATVDVDEQRRPRAARRAGGPPEQPWDGRPVLRRPGDGLGLGEADRLEPAGGAARNHASAARPVHRDRAGGAGAGAHRHDPCRTPVEAVVPARGACLDAAAGAGDDQPAEAVLVAHHATADPSGDHRTTAGPDPRAARPARAARGGRTRVAALGVDRPHVPPAVAVGDEAEPATVG